MKNQSKIIVKIVFIILISIIGGMLLMIPIQAKAEPVKVEVSTPKNKEVRKYHRRNNKTFTCSLCRPKGIRGWFKKRN